MKRMSWGCVVIGTMSIILSFVGAFVNLDGFKGFNLPFQFLVTSLHCGAIAVPKLTIFVNVLRLPIFDYIFSMLIVISGIGTIWIKNWGETLTYVYVMSIISLSIIGMLIILPGYLIMYNEMSKQGSLSLIPVFIGGGSYILTSLCALLYPIILLIFFSRPRIKEMFRVKR